MSDPENNESKGVNIGSDAEVDVGHDMIGGEKIIHGDELNAGRDINQVNVAAGASVGQLIVGGSSDAPFKREELVDCSISFLR